MRKDEGIDLITVHARLRREKFCRPPRWEWIGMAKEWLSIPVIANGSISSKKDAALCLQKTGADGLMIGRAAARKPWIFADIARHVYNKDIPEAEICLPVIYHDMFAALVERFRPERRLGRLKEFTGYFAENYPFGHNLWAGVQGSQSLDEAWEHAVSFFAVNDPEGLVKISGLAENNSQG